MKNIFISQNVLHVSAYKAQEMFYKAQEKFTLYDLTHSRAHSVSISSPQFIIDTAF